jgi:hypothetical protein
VLFWAFGSPVGDAVVRIVAVRRKMKADVNCILALCVRWECG